MMKFRSRLGELYASPLAEEEKRRMKAETFAELKAEYQQLKQSWNGFAGYDRFFAGELNNANLVPVATYSELVPAFRRMLAENGGNFERFYAEVKELGKLSRDERGMRLGANIGSGAGQWLAARRAHPQAREAVENGEILTNLLIPGTR
jgi:predicted aminopeptidase